MVMKKWESFSDNELLDIIRYGESSAYSELWRRHHKAAIVAAKNIAPHLDAQDLVSEAYLKIFKLLKTANGPTGLFRPYLYSVVRNLSADWSRQMEFPSEELDLIPDFETILPWQDELFDSDAATRAFGSLSDRWQTVLWYTEVEGLSPRHISQMMGISAHGVSVLASRAREALRSAWVEAHVVSDSRDQECHQTIQNLQRFLRRKLTAAASRQAEAHLKRCESCQNAANEFSQLNNQLALTLATLFVGAGAATALVAGFRSPATAVAASFGGSKSLGRGEVSASATGATGATGATTSVLSVPFVITAIATLSLSLASAGALLLPQFFSDNQHTQTASQTLSD